MDFTSPPSQFIDRPILLSPPPLDPSQVHLSSSNQDFSQIHQNHNDSSNLQKSQSEIVPNSQSQAQRQFSVGYNLQHEFETLTNDLDLDLKHGLNPDSGLGFRLKSGFRDDTPPGNLGFTQLASSKYFPSDLLQSNPLLRDNTISPIPQGSTNSGISSLLGSKWGNLDVPTPARPQSSHDFLVKDTNTSISNNFNQDLLMFTNWIETLDPKDTIKAINYLCTNLPLDILLTFKSSLDAQLNTQPSSYSNLNSLTSPTYYQQPLKNFQENFNGNDLSYEMDQLNLQDNKQQKSYQTTPLIQPKPKQNYRTQYLFQDSKNRPKSADPSLYNNMVKELTKSSSPTSHLYEKTNFLQAAANSNSPMHYSTNNGNNSNQFLQYQLSQPKQHNSDEDISAHTALKLGALTTINSRVALDSNRKHNHHQINYNNYQQQKPLYEESLNRAGNSSSVPLGRQMMPNSKLQKAPYKTMKSPEVNRSLMNQSPTASNSSMPMDVANLDLLNNIPAWLKLLRLHKYTDCLKDIPWRELVEYDNNALEDKGVVALGARRKLLKAFDVVKLIHL